MSESTFQIMAKDQHLYLSPNGHVGIDIKHTKADRSCGLRYDKEILGGSHQPPLKLHKISMSKGKESPRSPRQYHNCLMDSLKAEFRNH